jgi:hypothetical protein
VTVSGLRGRYVLALIVVSAGYHRAVRRGFVVFAGVAVAFLAMAAACGAPGASTTTQAVPAAEATDVRRTAVADVQRIIANNPTATPSPEPTATAAPSCQGAIWWHEARAHIGESRAVQGRVVGARAAPGARTLVELGQMYPDPTGFAVLVPGTVDAQLTGKTVCVSGRIARIEGMPTMQLQGPSSIVIVAERS